MAPRLSRASAQPGSGVGSGVLTIRAVVVRGSHCPGPRAQRDRGPTEQWVKSDTGPARSLARHLPTLSHVLDLNRRSTCDLRGRLSTGFSNIHSFIARSRVPGGRLCSEPALITMRGEIKSPTRDQACRIVTDTGRSSIRYIQHDDGHEGTFRMYGQLE